MTNQLFPAPLPDETVYSWVCRFHFFAAHADFKRDTLRKLGIRDNRPANEFPPYLQKLSELSGVNLDQLIFCFTNAHYFQPFMDQIMYEEICERLKRGDTSSLQSRIGAVANRITPGQLLKYCPLCAEEDAQQFGTSYWHRSHQLVGVTACESHGIHLLSVKRNTKTPQLPPLSGCTHPSSLFEIRLSKLIQSEIFDNDVKWHKGDTYQAYYKRLGEMELLTQSGRIKQKQLKEYLIQHLDGMSELDYPYPQVFHAALDGKLSESMFYRAACNHQPIKHFVFISALFDSWDDFKQSANIEEIKEESTGAELQHNLKSVNWHDGLKMISEGNSLRTTARFLGTTVSTLKIKAQQNNLAIDLRPSKITDLIERAIWRKLVVGVKTQDIADEFNVSVGAVEKVLTKHVWLPELRKRIWYFEKQRFHTKRVSDFIDEHPDATRNDIRKKVRPSYYWLYKHEQELLYQLLPKRVQAIYWPRKTKK